MTFGLFCGLVGLAVTEIVLTQLTITFPCDLDLLAVHRRLERMFISPFLLVLFFIGRGEYFSLEGVNIENIECVREAIL